MFEDLDADGVRDLGEPELEGWTVVLDRTDTPDLLLTIPNPTPATNDQFGRHLAAVGSNVLAGAELDDAGAEDAGVVHLFDGSTGELLHTFLNPTPDAADWFGKHLAASDNNVLIGATGDDTGAENTGAAYLFDGSTGQLLQTFLNPTPEAGERFGSVAPFGDKVLVGAGFDRHGDLREVGEVYLFDATTGELLWTFENPTPEERDCFGGRITAVGGNVLISANKDNTAGQDVGAAYLYEINSLTEQWELKHTFLDPTPHEGDSFGTRVAAMGDNVLIAEFPPARTGAVHLFDGSTGELLRTFLHPDPTPGDRFGFSIAVAGNNILIGAVRDDTGATDAGAAYLFDGTTGELLHTYLNPTPDVDDGFGSAASAVGNSFIIGARHDDTAGTDAGALYVFEGVSTTSTDAGGNYSFTDLEDGTYRIWQVSPEGYFQTAPGGDGSDTVIIVGGIPVAGPDFGMAPTTTTSYDNNVPKDLKDAKNAVRPGVTRSTVTIADSHRIVDLNVELSITHPRPEDLDVFLIAPDGTTRVELFTDVAGAGGTFTLDDEAPRSIVDAPDQYVDAYRPEGSLAAFDGMSTEGTWTLEIADGTKGEVGTLESWALTIEHIPFPPPPPGPPSIDSLSDSPEPVKQGQSLTLTANGVVDDGAVTSVAFYRDDGDGTLGAGDTLLATDTDGTDGWAVTIGIPSDFVTGVYVYFARATDNDGLLSNVVSTTNEVKRAKSGGKPKSLSADAPLAADRLFASSGLAIDFAGLLVDDRLFPMTPKKHAKRSSVDLILEDITAYTFDDQLAEDLAPALV